MRVSLNMKLVSIIVPIYNSEKYLEKCINSLLNQTYQEIEIILVDDGSVDGSAYICKSYQNKNEKIKYTRQMNAGVSETRNKGISLAKGEYIVFIDSDDYVVSDYIETLVAKIVDCDLSVCGYYEVNSMDDVIISSVNSERCIKTMSNEEYLEVLFESHFGYQGYIWNKLYKKNIIDKYDLKFDTDIFYNEDRLFVFRYLKYCKNIIMQTKPLYIHLINSDSAMGIQLKTYNNKMLSEITAFNRMLSEIEEISNIYCLVLVNACSRLIWIRKNMKLQWRDIMPIQDKKIVKNYTKIWFWKMYIKKQVSLKTKIKLTYHLIKE